MPTSRHRPTVAERLRRWLAAFDPAQVSGATLINNAAVLTRIGSLETVDAAEVAMALRVGLEAPLLLSAAFLQGTATWPARRRILNISSGLGRRAMAGQVPYCAVKAGPDHATRAMALDQAQQPNGARVVSLAPGVIDTDMQVALRAADPAGFPDKAMFVGLKEGGQLASSADAARACSATSTGPTSARTRSPTCATPDGRRGDAARRC
jgi:NAD(P)-dependent dehydrogenase (short-subunit alcohol dehydrogenase family)